MAEPTVGLFPVADPTAETAGDLGQLPLTQEEQAAAGRLGTRQSELDYGARTAADARRAAEVHYDTGQQKVRALAEGFLSGATLGGADLIEELLDGDNAAKRGRAEQNPGYRLGGELLGGLVLPVGSVRGVAAGAKAGALAGAGQGLSAAVLAEDPLTVDSVATHVGYGAILGGGVGGALGGIGGALGRAGRNAEAKAAARAVDELSEDGATRLSKLLGTRDAPVLYSRASQAADDAVTALGRVADELPIPPKPPGDVGALSNIEARNVLRGLRTTGDDLLGRASLSNPQALKGAGKEVSAVRNAWKELDGAAKATDTFDGVGAYQVAQKYKAAVDNLAAKLGEKSGVHPDIEQVMGRAASAGEEAGKVYEKALLDRASKVERAKDLATRLGKFPRTMEDLAAMTPDEVGSLAVTLNRSNKLATAVTSAFDDFISLGMKASPEALKKLTAAEIAATAGFSGPAIRALADLEGTSAARVVKAWAVLKNLESAALPKVAAKGARQGGHGGLREALMTAAGGSLGARVGMAGGHVGVVVGGTAGAVMGKALSRLTAGDMAATASAARRRVGSAVARWGKRVGRAYERSARPGASSVTHFTLNSPPKRGESPQEAFERLRADVTETMPRLRDRAFVASGPLRDMDLRLGDQMFTRLVDTMTHLHATMPKDPGGPGRLGLSRWKPSRQELATWGRRLAVIQDPAGAAERLDKMTLEEADTLKVVAPGFFEEIKNAVIEDLPRLQKELSYQEITSLSILLDEALDDTLTPEYIRRAQATHKIAAEQAASPDAQTPYHTPGKMGGAESGMTEAQSVTYR